MSLKERIFRIIGAIYFPIQFFAVWVLYFGFTIEPKFYVIYHAFGLEKIIDNVLRLIAMIPVAAFTLDRVVIFIIYLFPYLISILLSTYRIVIFAFVLYQLVIYIIGAISVFSRKQVIKNESAVVIVKIGGPGSGKSSSAGFDVIIKAGIMWAKLKYDYWRYKGHVLKWQDTNNIVKLQEWYEIRDAYEFYQNNNCIPCLWSSIPLMSLKGKKSNELRVEHLYQEKRLPAFSVLYIDEVGSMLDVELYRNRPFDLSSMFRFCRHFGNFQIICTEQSAENIFIDVRRVVGFNEYMLWQKWVCKPYPLLGAFSILKKFFLLLKVGSKILAPILDFFNSVIRHIGFRKYCYCYEGNTERSQDMYNEKKRCYYLPSCLNYFYDDRTYRNYYKAKDFVLESAVYGSLLLQEESEAGIRYLRMQEADYALEEKQRQEVDALVTGLLEDSQDARLQLLLKQADFKRKLIERALTDQELHTCLNDLEREGK